MRYREPGGRTAKQREKTLPRKREADAFASKVEDQKNEGTYKDPELGQVSVKAWAEQWLGSRLVNHHSYETYEICIRKTLVPYIGRKTLNAVSSEDIQRIVSAISEYLAPVTVRSKVLTISTIFNAAVESGRISANPCKNVELPRLPRKGIDPDSVPSIEQVRKIAQALPDRFELVVWLMAIAGLRISEALAVTEDCFRDGFLRVRWQTARRDGRTELAPLKHRTSGDYRDVPIPRFITEQFHEHCQRHGSSTVRGVSGVLFRSSQPGEFVIQKGFGQSWRWAVRERFTPHDLRHFFASTALHRGAALHEVSAWLGHSSISITADVYAHLVPSSASQLRSIMSDVLC